MVKPLIEIIDYSPNLPNVQAMNKKGDNEYTGRFCVKAVIVDPGDFIPEKNDPFEWFVFVGNEMIASGKDVYIEGEWVGDFMLKQAEKYETGIEFNPDKPELFKDGHAMKIGGRFRNLSVFTITIGVAKGFSDKDGNIYRGYWEKNYNAIHFMGDWGKIEQDDTRLADDNFPNNDEPEIDDPEPDDPEPDKPEEVEVEKSTIGQWIDGAIAWFMRKWWIWLLLGLGSFVLHIVRQ